MGAEVIEEARQAGVTRLVSVGTDAAQSAAAIAMAEAHEGVWPPWGCTPTRLPGASASWRPYSGP